MLYTYTIITITFPIVLGTRLENRCSVIQVLEAFLQLVLHTLHALLLEVSLVHHMNLYAYPNEVSLEVAPWLPEVWGFRKWNIQSHFPEIMDHHPLLSEW